MATVRWNGVILAESDHCRIVEGNYYFPPESVHREYLKPSRACSLCFWKGLASYYHIEVDGARNQDAAWYYPAAELSRSSSLWYSSSYGERA
jgi:uncharacterized protein (DUF427 family)